MRSFDAFLSHNSVDKLLVKEIGRWLADEAGLRVWLDEWNLIPGEPWQEGLEQALDDSLCCVVFLGSSGIGTWQNEEMRVALAKRVSHGDLRVVPVLLSGADRPRKESELPAFLRRLTWVRFGEDLKDEEALHRLLCGIRGLPPGRRDVEIAHVCPYRGLEVFRPQDRRFFFGRDALVERLLDYLEGHRFLAVVGPSGSGKSSVVQAGLVPELDDGETRIEILTPRERPLEELAFALRRCFPEGQVPPTEELLGRLWSSDEALHLIVREVVEALGARRVVLVVDQFEEVFTQTADDEERRRFVANLLGAVERSGPTSVILTLRSDFLGHCASDTELNVFVNDHFEQIGPMSREELESVVTDPARLVGLRFEDGLVEKILDDVKGSPGELPLLQHALLELYERRDGARLTLRAYQRIGGIEGALTRRAEEEYGKLDSVEKETLRKMFVLCLVKAGEGTEDTRRRATREELLAVGESPRVAESLLAQWTDARLLTTQGVAGHACGATADESRRDQLVDVAHEALIRKWERLAEWMAEGREEARLVGVLRQGAREWQREGRRPDYLFRGARLAQAKEVLASHGGDLTELERSFVAAAVARASRRLRLVAAVVAVALATAGYLVYDSNQARNAVERRLVRNYWNESQTARSQGRLLLSLHFMAEAIGLNLETAARESQFIAAERFQPRFALSQVLEHQGGVRGAAFNGDESRILTWSDDSTARLWDATTGQQIESTLKHQVRITNVVFNDDKSRFLILNGNSTARLWDAATAEPIGPVHSIRGAVFNGDGSRVLAWSRDRTAQLWDAALRNPIALPLKHHDEVRGAIFNGDESRILTWSDDHTARLWDAVTGQRIGPALKHHDKVRGAIFNGDGSRVLTWSDDHTARLWDTATGEQIRAALAHQGPVSGAVFNRDRSRVLTWSSDGTARLWDAATSEQIRAALAHQGPVSGAVFNRDESRVLTWSSDNTARLWDTATCEQIGPALEHQGSVLGAVFSRDESRVLTWGRDRTARLWDAATGEPIGSALKHRAVVFGAVFNHDESRILTWSYDNTARLWDATSDAAAGVTLEHQSSVSGAVFTRDDSRVLTWSYDNTARLWDTATGEPIGPPFRHKDHVLGAVFNRDESRVLTWSRDHTAQLWDTASSEAVGPALVHQDTVRGAVFTRDESRVLTWSNDNTARLWDAATSEPIGLVLEHQGFVYGAVLTRDESRVLTWSFDNTARLWDAATGEPIGPALAHQEPVSGAVFTRDESRVLTWSNDNTARLWDAATGEPIGPALEHQGDVWGAVFDRDESRVLTWGYDGTARLWNAATGKAIGAALKHQSLVGGARFNDDGSRALTWSFDYTARLWDTATGAPIGPPLEHEGEVLSAVFNHDGSRVLTWSFDNTARLWDAATSEPIGPPLEHQDRVMGAVFNSDESRVLTRSSDGTARLWDTTTGEAIGPPLEHQDEVLGAVFNGDESRVLTWSDDHTARLWDVGADLDFPADSVVLQMRAVTGTEFMPLTREARVIEPERWREVKNEWEHKGRAHYKVCRYPRYNLWRRFHVEDAERIRPLE